MQLTTICLFTGIAALLRAVVEFVYRLVPYFTKQHNIQQRYLKNKKDVWAIVTGASEGIGKDWAVRLSNEGFNIVLIARTVSKLEAVAKLLNSSVQYKIISLDFSNCDSPQFSQRLTSQLEGLKIGALINNVGVIDIERYHKFNQATIDNHIKVNMMSPTIMISSLIEKMYTAAKADNRKCIIVSMSSLSSESPMSYYQLYAATKSFTLYFNTALHRAYNQCSGDFCSHIDFLTLRPYFIKTAMVNFKSKPFTITPDQLVNSAFKLFGKRTNANGHAIHEAYSFAMSYVPEIILRLLTKKVSWSLVVDLGFKKND